MVISRDALWESGHDETVEVNQRALIDKVLARYSGEFTVFRELLQNSDDAQSSAVEIRFETAGYLERNAKESGRGNGPPEGTLEKKLPDLKTAQVAQWSFKNNGMLFRDEDWSRLKKIAEGNPDEEKIGAFGVGFYSLFSVTEDPMVTSGDQWMAFYWKDKKDQLYARRGKLPEPEAAEAGKWTIFTMPLREPGPIPIAFDFTRFLASSITFMTHLSEVSVYFDDYRLARLTKATGIPRSLGLPKDLKNRSPMGTMVADSIQVTSLHIKAEVMKWVYTSGTEKKPPPVAPKPVKASGLGGSFFSNLFSRAAATVSTPPPVTPATPTLEDIRDPLTINETGVALKIYSASISVRLDKKVSSEIQRATKKNPPTRMKYELIYTGKDEYDSSLEEEKKHSAVTGSVFQGLRADLEGTGSGRIFIGHSTAQTTGIGGHMAGRFIPTVERESIDFMDRNVAIWNKELLFIGGYLARSAYEIELQTIRSHWDALKGADGTIPPEMQAHFTKQVIHALKFFTFHKSTPSSDVSSLMESAFFATSTKGDFPIVSTQGIRNVRDVRMPDPAFAGFVKNVPMLSDETTTDARVAVSNLQTRGLLKDITFDDVLGELRSRPLSQEEFVACLTWWIGVFQGNQERLLPVRRELIDALVLMLDDTTPGSQKLIPLNTIKFFLNPKTSQGIIPLDGPLPPYLLPVAVSKGLKSEALSSCFPWPEFTVMNWILYITDLQAGSFEAQWDITMSPIWADRVLGVLARAWPSLGAASKDRVCKLLVDKTCIPTSCGMKMPPQAYFPNVNMFQDLPIVTLPSGTPIKGPLEKLLQDLGVRKHVELQIVFSRMIKTNEWTIAELTKYLVSVKSTLTADELDRLRATVAFPKEPGKEGSEPEKKRFRAKELYEPNDTLRALDLPIIDWGKQNKWKQNSEEAKFLFDIGLRRFPPLDVLIPLCASSDAQVRSAALAYLVEHIPNRYSDYDPVAFKDAAFIPALKDGQVVLAKTPEVFSSPEWATMGFLTLSPTLRAHAAKLRINEHPRPQQLIAVLESHPPLNLEQGNAWFALLSSRVNEFSSSDLRRLSELAFVPVSTVGEKGTSTRWLPPSQCYLGDRSHQTFHSKLFVFVDFNPAASAFLSACGAQNQPSVEEVVKKLLSNPLHFYELAGNPTQFMAELRNIAVNLKGVSSMTLIRMKRMPILLGLKRKLKEGEKKTAAGDELEEDEWDTIYDLKRPDEIIIADDTQSYQTFGSELFAAPQEDILEEFYLQLGCKRLSRVVKEDYQLSAEIPNPRITTEIRTLILERLPLFLHEHTHTPTRVSFSWLSAEGNFVVKCYGKITVVKTLNYGDVRASRRQDASAVARRASGLSAQIQLWISGNSQIDMYEVATSLNRLLFEAPKTNDALLFMTILSTDLKSLKRRGYNVDRILRQQREAREQARIREENVKLASQQSKPLPAPLPIPTHSKPIAAPQPVPPPIAPQTPVPGAFPTPPSPPPVTQHSHARPKASDISRPASPPTGQGSLMQNLRKWGTGGAFGGQNGSQTSLLNPRGAGQGDRPTTPSQRPGNAGPTPLESIDRNIEVAINACRSESGDVLQNREQMEQVKESLNEGYCDISGRSGNLRHIGQMDVVKVYVGQEVPANVSNDFMQTHQASIARFIHVLKPLSQVYQMPLDKLHIFYDLEGGLIAFNRNGSVFLNQRYFEAWHDADVSKGSPKAAYISWYFTLAHEMAHNLVHPHNSEHEFYMSAICEKYLLKLARLVNE